jgi:vesicle coat complex subunit
VLLVPRQLCQNEAGDCNQGPSDARGCKLDSWKDIPPRFTDLTQDMKDSNPLVRALALRTMSYIHVREFVEGTVPHVKHLLKDSDPYVRKTAAFCVAKLYDHDKDLVERSDLIERLNSMLRDDNPTVVASALASLMDIWERSDAIKLTIDYGNASKMVQILPDCSEYVTPLPFRLTKLTMTTDGARHIFWRH